jgi:hypothetical protein
MCYSGLGIRRRWIESTISSSSGTRRVRPTSTATPMARLISRYVRPWVGQLRSWAHSSSCLPPADRSTSQNIRVPRTKTETRPTVDFADLYMLKFRSLPKPRAWFNWHHVLPHRSFYTPISLSPDPLTLFSVRFSFSTIYHPVSTSLPELSRR